MPQNAFISWTRNLLVSQKTTQRHLFFHPPSPFPGNFCNCISGGICIAFQFLVQLSLLYTAWSNTYSKISLEMMLRPLVTSCVKDYKGHSLVQTSFAELPNMVSTFSLAVEVEAVTHVWIASRSDRFNELATKSEKWNAKPDGRHPPLKTPVGALPWTCRSEGKWPSR